MAGVGDIRKNTPESRSLARRGVYPNGGWVERRGDGDSQCDLCAARVTAKDLGKGRAIILLKKVWCQKCRVRMLEADQKRRAEGERRQGKEEHFSTTMKGSPATPRI